MKIQKALIVYNKPLYELLVLEEKNPYYLGLLKRSHPSTKNWVTVYEQHRETLQGVQSTLRLLGIRTETVFRKDLKKIGPCDLVVTVGGDGTVLETSHLIFDQVLLGVNGAPSESTGALCHTRLSTFLGTMIDLMTGEKRPSRIPRLKVRVGRDTLRPPALNEVLFANRSPAGTSRYIIQIGKKREEHKSSGVWMATGAGSTAAIRSAGGRVMAPTWGGLQYLVREPLLRPGLKMDLKKGVLKRNESITLIPTTRQSAVFIDGNHIEVPVEYGEKVVVRTGGRPLKMVL